MKRVLCISPHFPPVNAADMHRLRQALPHLREFGWEPVVFAVDPRRVEGGQDPLLLETVPADVEVHRVGAAPAGLTRSFGLGNLGFRSWLQLRSAVSRYLARTPVDLIFFSTTVFTSMAHGVRWRRQARAPLVVDLQDPWRNDYYLTLPRARRPAKFWFDFAQRKYLEGFTMPHVDGMIAVSEAYIETMRERYPVLRDGEAIELPFGAAMGDIEIARRLPSRPHDDGSIRVVYLGRGGQDMNRALEGLFGAVVRMRAREPQLAARLKFEFVGTSYAAAGRGQRTIMPVAERMGVADQVSETPDRLPYFETLRCLLDADMLFIPGSEDEGYTASKIYPYILSERPLLAIFHHRSSAVRVLRETRAGEVVTFSAGTTREELAEEVHDALIGIANALPYKPETDWSRFERYTAREMTRQCCELFDRVVERHRRASAR